MHNIKQVEECLTKNKVDLQTLTRNCARVKEEITGHLSKDPEDISSLIRGFILDTTRLHIGNPQLHSTIEKFITSKLHDTIQPILYSAFKQEDADIFSQCMRLQHMKFARTYADVKLPASIVELASLDAHRNAPDKLDCFANCYDLISAEIKYAIAELLTAGDDEAYNNAAIDRKELVRILAEVVLRAKCKHLYSNLYFVQALSDCMDDESSRNILQSFNDAIELLMQIGDEHAATMCRRSCSEMDLKQYGDMVARLEDDGVGASFERLTLTRVSRQISKSHEYVAGCNTHV